MELKKIACGVLFLFLSACVTEKKVDDKPYVPKVPTEVSVKTSTPPQGDMVPGSIVVKCRLKFDKDPKHLYLCGPTTVKLINEQSKETQDHSFKGDKTAIAVSRDFSYGVEVKTKGCDASRTYVGMSTGMVLSVQFDNCGGVATK